MKFLLLIYMSVITSIVCALPCKTKTIDLKISNLNYHKVYDKGRVLLTKENEKSIEYSLKSKQTTLKTTLEGKWNLTIYLNYLDAEWKVKDTIIDFSSINKKKYIHFKITNNISDELLPFSRKEAKEDIKNNKLNLLYKGSTVYVNCEKVLSEYHILLKEVYQQHEFIEEAIWRYNQVVKNYLIQIYGNDWEIVFNNKIRNCIINKNK